MKNKINKVIKTSVFVNMFLVILKILVGLIGKSGALIADGIHSLSDLVTDFVAILGNTFSRKPADKEHPLGHGKLEYLASLIIGALIIIVGVGIVIGAFKSEIVIPELITIVVTVLAIVLKLILSRYVLKSGIKYNNNILIASGKESGADVISSAVVLFSVILMQFSDKLEFLKYTNIIAMIIVGLFIIKLGISVVIDNSSSMLGKQVDDKELIKSLKEIINNEKEIISIDKFHLLKYGPYCKLIAEVSMNSNKTLKHTHDVITDLEKKLKKSDSRINYINIHVNPK